MLPGSEVAEKRGGAGVGVVGATVRALALAFATLTTGLIAGFFYAYACSVTRGLSLLPDDRYVAAMQAINATVRSGVFAFSFFGAALALVAAVAIHATRPRSRRFLLVALACVLYVGGGFLLTLLVNVVRGVDGAPPARGRAPRKTAPAPFGAGVRGAVMPVASPKRRPADRLTC